MDENSISKQSPRASALSCIVYLQYVMAGDMESVQLLDALLERQREIPWEDSTFIAFSKEMLGEIKSPFDADDTLDIQHRALAHALSQRNSEQSEALSTAIPLLQKLIGDNERTMQSLKNMVAYTGELSLYISKMAEPFGAMRRQLELLDADTEAFVLPDLPKPPTL